MSIELTDAKRYELEKPNIISVILDAHRNGHKITEAYLSFMLNIDLPTVDRLLTALRTDNIIK